MALVVKDRVKESSTTTGTGTFTLSGAEDGFQSFAVIGDGNTTYYSATDGTDWEVGIGTYTLSGTTLARTTILSSSNSGSAVNWGSGTKLIFVTQPSSKAVFTDASGDVSIDGQLDLSDWLDLAAQSSHPTHNEGRLWYDNVHKTLNYYSDDTAVVHELGIEEHARVYNETGSTIAKGVPCHFAGSKSDSGTHVPTIAPANATDSTKYKSEGMTAAPIANNSYGYLITAGRLEGLDTSHLSVGQFFTGITDGSTQTAAPVYPNYPMCLGFVVRSDASDGVVFLAQQNHSIKSFRVQMDQHIGGDLTIDGNLNVTGSTTTTSTDDVTAGAPFYRANEGDAIGEAGTTFSGSGLDDAFFSGHFTGTASVTYYVKIDGVGTGAGGVDTFSVSNDNFATTLSTANAMTGNAQLIHSGDNIYVDFSSTTGHTLNDVWTGTAGPINVDTGFFSNRNTGASGVGYTHMGLFYDASESKWRLVDEYDPVPSGTIDVSHSSYVTGTVISNLQGAVTGNVTGNLTGNVTGNLTGNSNGTHTGAVTGDVTGDTSGTHTGAVTGDVTGNLSGNVTSTGSNSFGTVALGDWTITEDGNGKLAFSHSGTVKLTLDDTGTLAAANDIFTDETL